MSQATEVIETAKRLAKLPAVAAAARAGKLSAQQAAAVADAAMADASAEARLVEGSRTSSLSELREECLRTKAAARPDAEARRRAIHAGRFLRSYLDAEGAWNLRMRDNPEVGAEVMASIEVIRDRLFRAARTEGRRESSEAYAADALAALADRRHSGRRPVLEPGPRSSCGWTFPHCSVADRLQARSASWPVSGQWRCRPSET